MYYIEFMKKNLENGVFLKVAKVLMYGNLILHF